MVLMMGLLLPLPLFAALTQREITEIAKEAYIYGYPVVENYRVMYHSTQDKNYPQYAPFNTFFNARKLSTPQDTLFVSPNVDTPYSYAVLYLKDEPVVISIPAFEQNRFIGVPIYDLYTHVVYTLSPKNMSHKGGHYLVANTQWKGKVPKGIDRVIRCETNLAYVLIRTQLFNAKDLKNVHNIQSAYQIQGLSAFLGRKHSGQMNVQMLPPLAPENPKS